MDKPKATNKNNDWAFLVLYLLVMDIVLISLVIKENSWVAWIPVVLIAALAAALICFSTTMVVLDEAGIRYVTKAFTRQYSWADVQQIGIERQLIRGGSGVRGVIALRIKERKKRILYTGKNMKCIRAYYGEPDYDRWGKEPCQC